MADKDANGGGKQIPVEVDVLVVGFGFSSIPLLRLLKADPNNKSYTIVSSGPTIWQRLKDSNKLHFNLVSSFHASYYAQDQVEDGRLQDFFPTATEFYEYHERIFAEFKDQVVDDKVTSVDNYNDKNYSMVYTASGIVYKAQQLVFATGLGRPQTQTILDWDYSTIQNKTVAFTTMGDTANMMISKLIPNGNRCIVVTNGFMAFEKELSLYAPGNPQSDWWIPIASFRTGKEYFFDIAQFECHALHQIVPRLWGRVMMANSAIPPASWLSRITQPHQLVVQYPDTYRGDQCHRLNQVRGRRGGAAWANGTIGIKYHAIDMYKNRYAPNTTTLEDNIRRGVLLNDIAFFHHEGMVETWRKSNTTVDTKHKTLSKIGPDGSMRHLAFDHLVQGGPEVPNLPPIYSVDSKTGMKHEYQYNYRESLYGVVPSRLKNIYFLGMTRPTTGGIANMNEMQAMMIHKIVTKASFRSNMYANIHGLIQAYNTKYYHCNASDPLHNSSRSLATDHLVFYGLYTYEIAKFLGLDRPILRTCLSTWNPYQVLRNFRFELLVPNNAIKFRMDGAYAVDGVKQFVWDTFVWNDELFFMNNALTCIVCDQVLYHQCVAMLTWKIGQFVLQHSFGLSPMRQVLVVALATVPFLAVMLYLFRAHDHWNELPTNSLPAIPFHGFKGYTQPLVMIYIARYGEWYWCFGIFAFWLVVAFLFRQFYLDGLEGRYLFGDLKWKHKHRPFWQQYKEAFHKVQAERQE